MRRRIFKTLFMGKPSRFTQPFTRLLSTLSADNIDITRTTRCKKKPDDGEVITWGDYVSDHMLEIDYTPGHGWGRPQIRPTAPLLIHPAAKVLHYASELFEGMKAFRGVDGHIRMFRPLENINRLHDSAVRTALPEFDQAEVVKCIKRLVSVDQDWVPYVPGGSLYIRPVMIGTTASFGVCHSDAAKLFVITGPVGPYFPTGLKAVRLYADPSYVRAWPGGCGSYKMGSNYAPTMTWHRHAVRDKGCQQCLWLYGDDMQMTEMGTMNLFVYWVNECGEEELVTPPLESGLILPGITRKSLLEVVRSWSEFKITEEPIPLKKFIKALNEGRIKEVFGSGTAAIVCPVKQILFGEEELTITDSESGGPLTQRLFSFVQDINYGRKPHPWMETVDVEDIASQKSVRVN